MRILLVDDDTLVAEFLTEHLGRRGHTVEVADLAVEAMVAVAKAPFDLMLCDITLSDFNGSHTVRAMRQLHPQIPIIVISSLAPDGNAAECERAGAAAYLQKPISLEVLNDHISLVAAARKQGRVGIVDADREHRLGLQGALEAMGCLVFAGASLAALLRAVDTTRLSMVLVGSDHHDLEPAVAWAQADRITPVIFGPPLTPERLEKLGVALTTDKPVQARALLSRVQHGTH